MDFGIKLDITDIPYYVDELLTTHKFKKEILKFLTDATDYAYTDIYIKNNKEFIINAYFPEPTGLDGVDLIKGICMQIPVRYNSNRVLISDLIVDYCDGSMTKGTGFDQFNYFSITDGFDKILNEILAKIQSNFMTIFINNVINNPKLICKCNRNMDESEWFISTNFNLPSQQLKLQLNVMHITQNKKTQKYSISTISWIFKEKATISTQEDLDNFVIKFVSILNENEEMKEFADALLDCLICEG